MQKKWLLIVVLLGGIVAVYLNYFVSNPPLTDPNQRLASNQSPVSKPSIEKTATLDSYIERLAETYRLKPDERFITAVANIHHFLTNGEKTTVVTKFADHHWQVTYQGTLVGQLPEYPDFQDLLGMLEAWTQQLAQHHHFTLTTTPLAATDKEFLETQLQQFTVPSIVTALDRLNKLWLAGTHSAELLPYATQALTLLVLQQQDELEAAEQISIQALTLLALTKALTTQTVSREEALLAYLFNYSTHARTIALKLATDDPIRHSVFHEDEALNTLVKKPSMDHQAQYLYLLLLANHGDFDQWEKAINQYDMTEDKVLPLLKTGLATNQFGLNSRISKILPYITLIALAKEVDKESEIKTIIATLSQYLLSEEEREMLRKVIIALFFKLSQQSEIATIVDFFETKVTALKNQYAGPFLEGDTYAAYFRGYFYSGLYRLGIHLFNSLSSVEATTQYAELLGNSQHPVAADFQRWYRNLAAAKAGEDNPQQLIKDLIELKEFGAPPLLWTLKQRKRDLTFGSPEPVVGVRALLPHLDTRPSHQAELIDLVYDALLDLPLTEKLGNNLVQMDSAHFQRTQVWLAEFKADQKALTTLLTRADLSPSVQLQALTALNKLGQTPTSMEQAYQTALKHAPNHWEIVGQYSDFLRAEKQFKRARTVVHQWLKNNKNHPSLIPIVMQVKIAQSYLQEGLLNEAWKTIKPVIASYKADALETAIDILVAKNQPQEAEEIAKMLYERYPDNVFSRTKIAKFFWQQKQYQQAATILTQKYTINHAEDWRFKIGKAFMEVFTEQSDQEAMKAYQSLLEQGVTHELLPSFVMAIAEANRFQLAEQMLQPLQYRSGLGQMMLLLKRYAYRKKFEPPEQALAWLETQIPAKIRGPVSMLAYDEGLYELLWEFVGEPPADQHGQFIWLLRASSLLKEKLRGQESNRQQSLQHHYEQQTTGHYNIIGRYLLGKADETELLPLLTNHKAECEVAYYLGLRAQVEGRYQDASNWYRVAVETGLEKNGEYRWAFNQLYIWRNKSKSLSQLAAVKTDSRE